MAKVVISPSVHNFTELVRPVSRRLSFSSRPKSRLSTDQSRPQSAARIQLESVLEATPRTFRSKTSAEIPLPVSGRRSISVTSFSSNGKFTAHLLVVTNSQKTTRCFSITNCLIITYW